MSMAEAMTAANETAKRMRLEEEAEKKVNVARVRLQLDQDPRRCFFKILSLQLECFPSWEHGPTAATDGDVIYYNPEFIAGLPIDQVIGVVCGHEIIHPVLGHHTRRGMRDPQGWNIAADLADNEICREAQFSLPGVAIYPGEGRFRDFPPGLTTEEYYSLLPEKKEGGGGGGGGDPDPDGVPCDGDDDDDGDNPDPGGCGGVMDAANDPAGKEQSDQKWKRAVARAAEIASKEKGTLPGALASLVDSILHPQVPWQDVLRDFVSRTFEARDDYTWRVPNRRYLQQGIVMPSLRSESLGHMLIHEDNSGSTRDPKIMQSFSDEMNGVLDARPCKATIVTGDTQVNSSKEWTPADGPFALRSEKGGGGTDHAHLWEYIAGMVEPPDCVICLTDGYTNYHNPPDMPVLWVLTPDGCRTDPPFGRVIRLGDKKR